MSSIVPVVASMPSSLAASRVPARSDAETESPGTVPRFRAAAAFGLAGMVEEAQSLVNDADRRYPDSTFVHTVLLPTTRAAIALFRGRAADAIAALHNATSTELGTVAGLVPFYLRGEAHLLKR